MDDVNNMDEATEALETGRGIDRRTMLKAAAAAGVFAGTWVAPRIETLGFAPAAAAGTPCIILSPASFDKNSHDSSDCKKGNTIPPPCCGQSFGDSGNSNPDRFVFSNPVTGCTSITVRTIDLQCTVSGFDPDVGSFGVIIESFTETTPGACSKCTIKDAVLVTSSGRMIQNPPLNNGSFVCAAGVGGTGVNTSVLCTDTRLNSSSRLAVRLACIGGVVGCIPP